MSSILESITEIGLRRLYKFILKRVLSQILLDDLSLDQITLTSRDGTIQLTDLALNCDYLNQFSDGLPLRIRSCKVNSILAKVSYTNILQDGISVEVSGVEIEVEPSFRMYSENNAAAPTPRSSSSTKAATGNDKPRKPSNQEPPSIKDADVEGLQFLASWVEIIIAKLKVSVSNVNVSFFDSTDVSSAVILVISVGDASFYNSHPHDRHTVESSVDLSTRFQSNGASVSNFGKRKVPFNSLLLNLPFSHICSLFTASDDE